MALTQPAGPDVAPAAAVRCLVALAASAGGLRALTQIVAELPAGFPAAVVVVQHLAPEHPSRLAEILSRRTLLAVRQAAEGDLLRPATVYIAPPDRHLIVNAGGTLSLTETPRVHFTRPSADALFESAALAYTTAVIAVVLSGWGEDGATGIRAIKRLHGVAIAQDERTSEAFGMPGAAIRTGEIDYVLPLEEIAPMLIQLAMQGAA